MEGVGGAPNKTNNRVTVLVTTFTQPVPGVQNVGMAQRDVSMKNQATIYKETPVGMNCPVGGAKFYERDSL